MTVVAVLAVVVAGSQLPSGVVFARLTPGAVLIAVVWVVGLLLVQRAQKHLPWQEEGEAPESQSEPKGHSKAKVSTTPRKQRAPALLLLFLLSPPLPP